MRLLLKLSKESKWEAQPSKFTSWVTLGKLLNLFGLSFLICRVGNIDPSSVSLVVQIT